MMRAMPWLFLSLLAVAVPAQDHFVGVGFGSSPLFTYAVSATGEITLVDQTSATTFGELVRIDPGGRFAITFRSPDDVNVWKVVSDGSLSLVSSAEVEEPRELVQDLSLSQDSTIALALAGDPTLPGGDPQRLDMRTFRINNRLEALNSGSPNFMIPNLGNAIGWVVSDISPHVALVNFGVRQEVGVLWIDPSTGAITDTGLRIGTGGLLNEPWDVSEDGRWAATGGNIEIALFEIDDQGNATLRDVANLNPPGAGSNGARFTPSMEYMVGLSIVEDVATVELDTSSSDPLGGVIDTEQAGLGAPEAFDLNRGGDLLLVDSQASEGGFSLFSFFLNSDGQLTPTGHTLNKGFKLADLQYIPERTPPTLLGDANLDGRVDAADVVFLVNEAMPDDKPILLPQSFANADLDGDVDVDEEDLQGLVDLLLGR